ncbi:MAG: hypothetical protein AAF750_04730 [Planctomycetota bacterium]
MGFFRKLFRPGPVSTPPEPPPPAEVQPVGDDDDFIDLDFVIRSSRVLEDGSRRIEARGLWHGQPIAFGVILGRQWTTSELEDAGITLHGGQVELIRLGDESDRFLAMLAELYGIPAETPRMTDTLLLAAVSLEGDPERRARQPMKLKLFYEAEDDWADPTISDPDDMTPDIVDDDVEDPLSYAEVYLNLSIRDHQITLAEKDPEYRAGLIRALTHGDK